MIKFIKSRLLLLLSILLVIALPACAGGGDAPAQTIELYNQALVEKDQDRLVNLTCAEYESQALLEFDSFVSVETELVDVTCQTVGEEGDTAKVSCQGAISATYQGEVREFDLSSQTYLVVQEGGEWRMCGYD